MKNMHKNTSVEEDPSFLFNSGGKSEIFKDFYQSDNELNNHSSSEQKIIELSNNNSLIEQEKIKLDNDILNNISYNMFSINTSTFNSHFLRCFQKQTIKSSIIFIYDTRLKPLNFTISCTS